MVTLSDAYCGLSFAGIAGSNPAVGMDVCLLCEVCVVRYRSLRWADQSPRGVLTECGVSEFDREASIMRKPQPTRGCCVVGKKYIFLKSESFYLFIYLFVFYT